MRSDVSALLRFCGCQMPRRIVANLKDPETNSKTTSLGQTYFSDGLVLVVVYFLAVGWLVALFPKDF